MKTRVVVPLLAAAALVIGVENWLFFSSDSPQPAAASEGEDADSESPDDTAGSDGTRAHVPPPPYLGIPALAALLATFDDLRSPFLPTRAEASNGLGLPDFGGLLIGSGRRIAWLGDHARSEGELYQGWTVARIEESRVVLEREGRRYSLWLDAPSEEEKTP